MAHNPNTDVLVDDAIDGVYLRTAVSKTGYKYKALIIEYADGLDKMMVLEAAEARLIEMALPKK